MKQMTAEQFMATLATLDIGQGAAAELLGVDIRTIKRWRYKERKVPPPVAHFLTYLVATKTAGSAAIAQLGRQTIAGEGAMTRKRLVSIQRP